MKAPTFELTGTGVLALGALGAVGLLGLWLYSKKDAIVQAAADAAETAVASVNPASDRNLAYRGVNGIGGAITGVENWSLGGAIYDLLNPEPKPAVPDTTPQPDPYGVAPYFAP